MIRNEFVCNSLCLGVFLFAFSTAHAQTAPVGAKAPIAAPGDEVLQEVIVTAERRPEEEQRTPVSVTVYNASDLAREGVVDMESLAAADPSLQFNRNGGNGTLTLRGVSTNNTTEVGNPSVPISIDDFVINRPTGLDTTLFDIGQIEVLRGPQGTLFGRSATGGIVNITTARPTKDFEMSGDLEYGNYNEVSLNAAINVPISDALQMRVATFARSHSGYRVDTTPLLGSENASSGPDDLDAKGGRVEAAWQVTEHLHALLIYQRLVMNQVGPAIQAITFNFIDPTNINSDIYHTMPNRGNGKDFPIVGSQYYKHDEQYGKWHFDLDLPADMTLTYLGGVDIYERHELDSGDPPWPPAFDSPAALGPWVVNGYETNEHPKTQNQELRLASSQTGPLVWQGGLYYFVENNSLFNGVVFNADSIQATHDRTYQYGIHTDSVAAYGQGSYSFGSAHKFSLGARYSRDDLHRWGIHNFTRDQNNEAESSRATWHAGYEFTPTPVNMMYAKVDTGYKPGGFSSCGDSQQNYVPENVTNFEVGTKNRFLNDRLQANLSIFDMDYKDQQVSQYSRSCSTGLITTNAGESHIYGIEGQLTALVTDADRMELSASFLRARYDRFNAPPEFGDPALADCRVSTTLDSNGNVIGRQCNLAGNTMPQAPTATVMLALQHNWHLPQSATLSLRLEGRYSTKEYLTAFDFPDETQQAFTIANAFLTYSHSNWQVSVFARNFTDTTYINFAQENAGGADYYYAYGAPRTFGVRFQAQYRGSGNGDQ
jgi:iron complex outermembrane receptor protein